MTEVQPPPIAFYAPMKHPEHPVPSGDRLIARLLLQALGKAGYAPRVVSDLRTLDIEGCRLRQEEIRNAAVAETARLTEEFRPRPPRAWFTYHSYYKAPDLLGFQVARALGIPYLIAEPSISPKQRRGPWAAFAAASEAALRVADRLLWTTERDRPALEEAGHGAKMVHLPAFVEAPAVAPLPRPASAPLRLLAVAMMRPGSKLNSYRHLAAALHLLEGGWRLTVVGDGAGRAEVEALFAPFGQRVAFTGAVDDAATMARHYGSADLLVWPGVGEGVGMVWLEAQAMGVPMVAEDGPAARAALGGGVLAAPGDAAGFAAAIARAARDREHLSAQALRHIATHHSLDAAAARLRQVLGGFTA